MNGGRDQMNIENAAARVSFSNSAGQCCTPSETTAYVDNELVRDEIKTTEESYSGSPTSLQGPNASQAQGPAYSNSASSVEVLNSIIARGGVPHSLSQAKNILRFGFVDNSTGKAILKALKITGAQNAKVSTKPKVIAMKMTQRQFCLQDVMELLDRAEAVEAGTESEPHFLQELLPSAVKIEKDATGIENILWIRGDAPIFNGEEIKINEPANVSAVNTAAREPDFEASEYCRLLHILGDARMTTARYSLMEPKSREELDREPVDPWTDSIAPLFNDASFQPHSILSVAGGLTRDDIASIDPSKRIHERSAGVLKRKFGEFKSMYKTALAKYESSGQGDPDSFVHFANARSYIMYAFCFLKVNPLLQPLATRTLASEVQREEGVGDGVASDGEPRYGNGRKRKREKQEISIVGMESLSSVFRPFSDKIARATEEAEKDNMVYEAAEAKAKSAQSLLSAIKQAKDMSASAATNKEKEMYAEIVSKLMGNLQKTME